MRGSAVRRIVVALSGVTLVMGAAACSAAPAGQQPEMDMAPVVPAGLEQFYEQNLTWGPCAPFASGADERTAFADPKLDCARLEVPLDYAAPTGRTAQVALLRQRTTKKDRIGSLVVNPGGPGGSGMSLAAARGHELGDGPFDLVGFDPRGVGHSTPTITCASDAERDVDRADVTFDPSPAGVAVAEAKAQLKAQRCVERSGGVEVLANAGTRDVARDMDVLRAVLGDRKLSYLGFSYGTRIGTTYAEMFPGNVRAVVLDGVVDPTETAAASSIAQMTGFQQAFQTYAADCARTPACPLGSDPARTTEAFQALTRPLIAHPARVTGDPRTLSYSDAVTGAIQAMYTASYWPMLTTGLTELKAGDGATLMKLADAYYERRADGSYPNMQSALMVVNCLDGHRMTDPTEIRELSRRLSEVAPFTDDGRGPSSARDDCAFLPVSTTSAPHVPSAAGLPPVLVISTTGDPATPYQAGVTVADALHARLLTVQGTQHTAATDGYPCVDDIVADYLTELTLPTAGARCALPQP